MYILYLSTIGFILFTIYNCFFSYKNSVTKKFDHKKKYLFMIKNIEFFKDDNCIECKNYNNYCYEQKNMELNVNFLNDFLIVNYIYDNIEYKYYSENSFLTFPMYSSDEIKNYVYINKINSAKLLLKDIDKKDITKIEEIDILSMLIQFVGPNYNFYKDLNVFGIKLNTEKILKYLKFKNCEVFNKLDIENKNYELLLYDNFNNKYNIDIDYLTWNPELKL